MNPIPTERQERRIASGEMLNSTQVLRIVALGLLLIGCFVVIRPFVSSLMWAVVLAISCWPVYARIEQWLGGRRTLAAALMTLLIVLVMLAPFVVIGASLADNVRQLAAGVRRALESPPPEPPQWLANLPGMGSAATDTWRDLASDSAALVAHLRRFIEPVTVWLLGASVQFAQGLAELALSIFIAFFLFRDGPAVARRLLEATENLAGQDGRQLLDVAGRTVRGVVYGILGTALAQSILAGIGLTIAGVPGSGFLALLTFFLSVVPVGPPLVWGPAAIWLFAKGSIGWGIFMTAWGVLLVSSVDNVIKPMIISQGSRMPFILIFLGVLGGAIAFGFIGVFLGPTILVVVFRLLEQWKVPKKATGEQEAPANPKPA